MNMFKKEDFQQRTKEGEILIENISSLNLGKFSSNMDRGSSQAKKIFASGNFSCSKGLNHMQYYVEKPMMLNVWTQTSNEDFNNADLITQNLKQNKIKELTDKISLLENNLRVHSEMIAQFNPVERKNQLCDQATAMAISQRSPNELSVINPLQSTHSHSPTESIKYTIIADGHDCTISEPIEIHLAEEDGALNLNNSSESGRLEICLADEVKSEDTTIKRSHGLSIPCNVSSIDVTPSITSTTPLATNKRRKLVYEQESITLSNYYCKENNGIAQKNEQNIANSGSVKSNILRSTIKEEQQLPTTQHLLSATSEQKNIDVTDNVMVSIGPNNTRIPAKIYENMSWTSASIATRKLLMAIFDRYTLATHSMTGKPSPAFKDHKPQKEMLDPLIIQDIIFAVTRKCNVSDKEVRNAITTKCADENKMMKLQMNKNRSLREINKENVA